MCRFPIWSYTKLGCVCWLVLPYFNGAAYVYENFIRPFYRNPGVKLWYIPGNKGIFSKPDDVLIAAEKYIEQNGPQAFERLIARVYVFFINYFDLNILNNFIFIFKFILWRRLIEKREAGGAATQSFMMTMNIKTYF